jgi:hypothetical protein
LANGGLAVTGERDDVAQAAGGSSYLAWSRTGRATLPRYLAGLVVILLAWLAGTVAVQVPLIVAGRGTPVAPATPAGQLAGVLATFTLALVLPGRCAEYCAGPAGPSRPPADRDRWVTSLSAPRSA